MNVDEGFLDSAKSLARNPLGIIALFIVLVYAVASIVISTADADFYKNPFHPAVLFLGVFPVVVLIAFTYLVAFHHRKLYAPKDYHDSKDFFYGLDVPKGLDLKIPSIVTTGPSLTPMTMDESALIESKYTQLLDVGFVLLHRAEMLQERTSPKSARYRVRVWLEPIDKPHSCADIEKVTYHVWRDFSSPIISTSNAASNFDVWLSTYGEFPVLAVITLKTGAVVETQRYIDLPGRPID